MDVLERHVVILDVLSIRERRKQVADVVLAFLDCHAAENTVLRTEVVVDTREVLVLVKDVGDGLDRIDVEDVGRVELRKRYKLVQQRLRVLVNTAGRDN